MSRRQLTQKQHAFLEFLRSHVETQKVWPTYREIVDHFGYRSPNSVTQNLQALARKGYLHRSRDGYALVDRSGHGAHVRVRGTFLGGRVEPGGEPFSLETLFGGLTGLHAIKLHGEADRTASLGEAHYVFVAEGDAPEGETVVVLGGDRLALGRVGPDGTVETDEPVDGGEVIGRYAGHAGPYGIVRHRPEAVEA